jgi:hypothetical protein
VDSRPRIGPPFTFVDSFQEAIGAAREYAGDRVVDMAGGESVGVASLFPYHEAWHSVFRRSTTVSPSAYTLPSTRLPERPEDVVDPGDYMSGALAARGALRRPSGYSW